VGGSGLGREADSLRHLTLVAGLRRREADDCEGRRDGKRRALSLPNLYADSRSSALRPYAARPRLGRFNESQEVDTFNLPLRLVDDPAANGADRNTDLRVARKAAIGAAEAFWLALIAALVAWGVSPSANPSRGSTGSSLSCLFVGKGGAICNGAATAAQKISTGDADPCVSLGKGTRYCPPTK
jgi:hypothetical protein